MYIVVSIDPSRVMPRHAAYGPYNSYEQAENLRHRLLAQSVDLFPVLVPYIAVVPLESAR